MIDENSISTRGTNIIKRIQKYANIYSVQTPKKFRFCHKI